MTGRGLSPSMLHVIGRCSEADRWDGSGRSMPRQWPDLVYGRRQTAFQTIRSLVDRGLLYEDENGDGYGLTSAGFPIWLDLHSRARSASPGEEG